jgi:hypothetical protein
MSDRILSIPHVYVYGPPFSTKQQKHPVLDLEPRVGSVGYRSWNEWFRSLTYSSPHGEFDLYIEPAKTSIPCGCVA